MRAFINRLVGWFRRDRAGTELDDEIAAHVDFMTSDLIASGMPPEQAARAARLKFGGALQTREAFRDRQGWPWLEHLMQDLLYAVRVLTKRPALLATTTVSIGLGVGINVAFYSAFRSVLEQTRAAPAASMLFQIQPGLSYPNYLDIRSNEAFADLAARQSSTLTYRTGDSTTTIGAAVVSDNFLEVENFEVRYGRRFGTRNDARTVQDPNVVVISYDFWRRLGGDQTVIGRTLYLNGWPYTVAGVLPQGTYSMLGPMVSPSVYVPIGPRVNVGLDDRGAAQFDIVGRPLNGAQPAQLAAALTIAATDLERRFPDRNAGLSRSLSLKRRRSVIELLASTNGTVVVTLLGALGAIMLLVLLIACANVAGLLLARAVERHRETSIRIALGATRRRLIQQFLAESFVVATLGCVAGASLWIVFMQFFLRTSLVARSGVDVVEAPASWTQCAVLAVLVTVACGLGPALTANQQTPRMSRHPAAGFRLRRWGVRQSLVAGQIGVSFIFLAAAAALVATMVRQLTADPGFDIEHTISVQMRRPTTSAGLPFISLREAAAALPGVTSVSSGDLPVALIGFDRVFKAGSGSDAGISASVINAGPAYFATTGLHLLRGRDLRDEDLSQFRRPREAGASALTSQGVVATPALVSELFARRCCGSLDILDQEFVLPRNPESGQRARRLRIVGIAEDSAIQVFGGDRVSMLYVAANSPSLVIRVKGEATTAVREVERTFSSLEPGTAITVAPMTTQLSTILLPVRMATIFLSALGALGLVLAITGLYGAISYAAARRRFEMGVRAALGAPRSTIVQLILRDAVVLVGAGSVIGSLLSFLLLRAIWPLLAGAQNGMLSTFAIVVVGLLILLVSLAAALRPALAAARVSPMLALRQD
jgi:predicted permease